MKASRILILLGIILGALAPAFGQGEYQTADYSIRIKQRAVLQIEPRPTGRTSAILEPQTELRVIGTHNQYLHVVHDDQQLWMSINYPHTEIAPPADTGLLAPAQRHALPIQADVAHLPACTRRDWSTYRDTVDRNPGSDFRLRMEDQGDFLNWLTSQSASLSNDEMREGLLDWYDDYKVTAAIGALVVPVCREAVALVIAYNDAIFRTFASAYMLWKPDRREPYDELEWAAQQWDMWEVASRR